MYVYVIHHNMQKHSASFFSIIINRENNRTEKESSVYDIDKV